MLIKVNFVRFTRHYFVDFEWNKSLYSKNDSEWTSVYTRSCYVIKIKTSRHLLLFTVINLSILFCTFEN